MTAKHRQFIRHYLEGGNATEAMVKTFPDLDRKQAGSLAGRWLALPEVQGEIALAQDAAQALNVLSAAERREWIAKLVRADPRHALEKTPELVQSVEVTRRILDSGEVEEKAKIKLPDKLRAIEVDAKLATVDGAEDTLDGLAEGFDALFGLTVGAAVEEEDETTLEDAV